MILLEARVEIDTDNRVIAVSVDNRFPSGVEIWLKESINMGIVSGNIIIADREPEFFNVPRLPLKQLMKFIVRAVKVKVMARLFWSIFMLFSDIIRGAEIMIGRLLVIKLFRIFAII